MDAVHHSFETLQNNCTTHVLKRQGGHLRGAVYIPSKSLAYVADAQLCTQKNDEFERRLVVRFYHIQDDLEAQAELSAQWRGIQERSKEQGHQQEVGKSETETQPTSGLSAMMSPSAASTQSAGEPSTMNRRSSHCSTRMGRT